MAFGKHRRDGFALPLPLLAMHRQQTLFGRGAKNTRINGRFGEFLSLRAQHSHHAFGVCDDVQFLAKGRHAGDGLIISHRPKALDRVSQEHPRRLEQILILAQDFRVWRVKKSALLFIAIAGFHITGLQPKRHQNQV